MTDELAKVLRGANLSLNEYKSLSNLEKQRLLEKYAGMDFSPPEVRIINEDGTPKTYSDYFKETYKDPVAGAAEKVKQTAAKVGTIGVIALAFYVAIKNRKEIADILKDKR